MYELTLEGETAMKWKSRPCASGVESCLRWEPNRSVLNWKDLLINVCVLAKVWGVSLY